MFYIILLGVRMYNTYVHKIKDPTVWSMEFLSPSDREGQAYLCFLFLFQVNSCSLTSSLVYSLKGNYK